MKKIFTLIVAVACVTTAMAQISFTYNGEPIENGASITVNDFEYDETGLYLDTYLSIPDIKYTVTTESKVKASLTPINKNGTYQMCGFFNCVISPVIKGMYNVVNDENTYGQYGDKALNVAHDLQLDYIGDMGQPLNEIPVGKCTIKTEVYPFVNDDYAGTPSYTFEFTITLDPNYAGIDDVVSDEVVAPQGVYNFQGVKVADSNDTTGLPAGLYIVGGKKTLVK